MKIYNSHIYGNYNTGNVKKTQETNAVQKKRTHKIFSVSDPDAARKSTGTVKTTEDLNKMLSTEEKHLFEQLFSSSGVADTAGPARAYKLQQNHNDHSFRNERKILGNLIDLRG